MISITAAQPCHGKAKRATENIDQWTPPCSNEALLAKMGGEPDLAHEPQFAGSLNTISRMAEIKKINCAQCW